MAVFRVERNSGYTVMSNHHLRNKELTLKAKGLLSQMLSLPEDWDYALAGLSYINRESIDAIRTAVWEFEKAGYLLLRCRKGFDRQRYLLWLWRETTIITSMLIEPQKYPDVFNNTFWMV